MHTFSVHKCTDTTRWYGCYLSTCFGCLQSM